MQSFAQESYLDILINYTPTKLHYGNNHSEIKDFRDELWGWQIGATFQGGITPYFSVVPEFYYMEKGGRLDGSNASGIETTKTRFHVLELPILARLHYCHFFLNAGPSISLNMAGKIHTAETEESPSRSFKMPFNSGSEGYKRWDAALHLGAGYEFKIKNSRIILDVRYYYGLVNMVQTGELYNRYFNINLLVSKPWKTNPFIKK
ncbi:hypothetical protein GCM10025777_54140 [Membranihabitans marinus]